MILRQIFGKGEGEREGKEGARAAVELLYFVLFSFSIHELHKRSTLVYPTRCFLFKCENQKQSKINKIRIKYQTKKGK